MCTRLRRTFLFSTWLSCIRSMCVDESPKGDEPMKVDEATDFVSDESLKADVLLDHLSIVGTKFHFLYTIHLPKLKKPTLTSIYDCTSACRIRLMYKLIYI